MQYRRFPNPKQTRKHTADRIERARKITSIFGKSINPSRGSEASRTFSASIESTAMMTKTSVLPLLVIVLCHLLHTSDAIWLNLPATGTKCVSEEIQNNVIVLADYVVIADDHTHQIPAISVKVTSPYGNSLHHQENVTHGQFAFTTSEAGNYLACFWVNQGHAHTGGEISVNLDWRTGIAAKDWESVARKEKLEGVELELKKLEGAVEAIHENLLYLKSREADMRTVSEKTNARVAWFSIMSLGICIGVSAFQLWHLKTYFQKKKLI